MYLCEVYNDYDMEEKGMVSLNEEYLMSKIYIIRGVQVMLDFDLAAIYGYTTKNFNRQVKNNIDRFDEELRFQLTDTELENLRCNFCTSSSASPKDDNLRSKFSTSSWGGTRYLPYAFTEEGIYMLMTVLKGELAVKHRYIFIDHATQDEMIFHCGGSSKDGGKRVSSISRVEDTVLYQNIVGSLEGNPMLQL